MFECDFRYLFKKPKVVEECHQKGPTCYTTSVSYLTGIPIQTLHDTIGHNGSVKKDYIGFHRWEMSLALLRLGQTLTEIVSGINNCKFYPDWKTLCSYVRQHDKVVIITKIGEKSQHAYAWRPKDKILIDPATGIRLKRLPKDNGILSVEILKRYVQ